MSVVFGVLIGLCCLRLSYGMWFCVNTTDEAPKNQNINIPYGVDVVGFDPDEDYIALMLACAEDGSGYAMNMGKIYEAQRNMMITEYNLSENHTEFFKSSDPERVKINIKEYFYTGNEPKIERFYTENDVIAIAKVLYLECRGIKSDTEKACVAWTIMNRVDDTRFPDTPTDVVTAPNQFAYSYNAPVIDSLKELANDVLERWNLEKNGYKDVGRVLPRDYMWFVGDGSHNYFRNKYRSGDIWDYSMKTPYDRD